MAKCDYCKQEMTDHENVLSCKKNDIQFKDGTILPQSTEHMGEPSGRCHDCGIKHGGFHHPGCDAERCPKCHSQIIGCDCGVIN